MSREVADLKTNKKLSFFKKLANLWKLAGLIEVKHNGKAVILKCDDNLVIQSTGSTLLFNKDGYIVEHAKAIHHNPAIRISLEEVDKITESCDAAVISELKKIKEFNLPNKVEVANPQQLERKCKTCKS